MVVKTHPSPALAPVSAGPAPAASGPGKSDQANEGTDAVASQAAGNAPAGPTALPSAIIPDKTAAPVGQQAADPKGIVNYSVQSPPDKDGWVQLSFETNAVEMITDDGVVHGSLNVGLGLEFDEKHPTSTTVSADGSTIKIYTRPDGSTLSVTTLPDGTEVRVVNDKSKGATAAPAGPAATAPAASSAP
jgi:hypothetical protein